jgi:hypothetical protein
VTSLSFSLEENPYSEKEAGTPGLKFWVPNFTIGTSDALVVGIDSGIFDELNPEDRRGVLLLQVGLHLSYTPAVSSNRPARLPTTDLH